MKYTTVLLQHVNSEMLMTDVESFLFSEVLATDCLGQYFGLRNLYIHLHSLRNPGILVSGLGKRDV